MYYELGRHEDALKVREHGAILDPNNPQHLHNLAISYMKAGRHEEAIEAYRKEISLAPDNARAHYELALAYLSVRDLDHCLAEWEAVRSLDDELTADLESVIEELSGAKPESLTRTSTTHNVPVHSSPSAHPTQSADSLPTCRATSEDFLVIQTMAARFRSNLQSAPRLHTPLGDVLNDPDLENEGRRITSLLRSTRQEAPDDQDVRLALADHLFRMGLFYWESYTQKLIDTTDSEIIDLDISMDMIRQIAGLSNSAPTHAAMTCHYLVRSIELEPTVVVALTLGEVFRAAGFYGTALHWYEVAIETGATTDEPDHLENAQVRRLELMADGHTSDPPLGHNRTFPTRETAGLQLQLQPPEPQPVQEDSILAHDDWPKELQVAISYLRDIVQQVEDEIQASDNIFNRQGLAKKILNGDFARATQEINKAAAQGVDVREARSHLYYTEGLIYWYTASSGGTYVHEFPAKGWAQKAIEAFKRSIQESPSAEPYMNMGLAYALLKRKQEAIDAYAKAQELGDDETRVEATKEIGRLQSASGGCAGVLALLLIFATAAFALHFR